MENTTKVILIAGRIGAGKTYLATLITNYLLNVGYSVFRTSFAYSLKKVLLKSGVRKDSIPNSIYFTLFRDSKLTLKQKCQYWYYDFINNAKGVFNDLNLVDYLKEQNITEDYPLIMEGLLKYFIEQDLSGARLLLQNIGSLLRNYNEDIFVNYTKNQIANTNADITIIDDFRYPNEEIPSAFKIKIININDKNREQNVITTHDSETNIDKLPYDFLLIRDNDKYEPDVNQLFQKLIFEVAKGV